MSRIDFYVLSDQSVNGRPLLACRLAEKAYSLGHRVYIHTASAEQARRIDDLLWTFRQGSFVPHNLYSANNDDTSPVLIGWDETTDTVVERLAGTLPVTASSSFTDKAKGTLLINLAQEVPPFFERFERVAEPVDQHPEILQKSRDKFRFFREHGYTPESHRL